MIKALILAGGSGSRLWPLSRAAYPKQFLSINSNKTLFQETLLRLKDLKIDSSITICNEDHRFFVAEQLKEINSLDSIILEPMAKNTAPAIALGAFESMKDGNDPFLLVLPADHVIQNEDIFIEIIKKSLDLAENDYLVTFGIEPNTPHTGYGYIKKGKELKNGFHIDQFAEKPSLDLAKEYFISKNFYWNSGMFLFKASAYLKELKRYRLDIFNACECAIKETSKDLDFIRIDDSKFKDCPSDSIDYAVMEKTTNAVVVPMSVGWNDIGSWSSLSEITHKDENGNSCIGDVSITNSSNSFILAQEKLVTAIGINDMIVVSTKDAVMVVHKDNAQDVKIITESLKNSSRNEWQFSREVYRPWGKFDSIDQGDGYQVKRITVNPGAKLSVQYHNHRAEHWVVVSGTAKVTNGSETFLLNKNESTYIPLGAIHALENPTNEILELIEVQSGDYLGEDDIVRIEDKYGREKKN